ncbi:unnamed protein product [Penicillium crustosum]
MFLVAQMPPFGQLLGLCQPMRPKKFAPGPQMRRLETLRICLVTKGTNLPTAVNKVLGQSAATPQSFDRVSRSCRQTELRGNRKEGSSYIIVDQVPKNFSVEKTKYKARAQEYFRLKYKFSKEDLHLDKESEMDDRALQTTLDFIERGTAELGVGTISYTASNHWRSMLMSAAEVNRVAEDFARSNCLCYFSGVRIWDRLTARGS